MTSTRNPGEIHKLIADCEGFLDARARVMREGKIVDASKTRPGELLEVKAKTAEGHPGAWICVLGLVICLMGCQQRAAKAPPPLPPPLPEAAAPQPRPVHPTFYVTTNQLSLRACPGTDCPKTSSLPLNAEVEKMGEVKNWAQVKVKKDGTIGYVSSRYLSPKPVEVGQVAKKKHGKAKPHKAAQPAETAVEEGAAGLEKQEPTSQLPRVM